MKLTYKNTAPTPSLTLDDLCYGSVFRPFGSQRIFMLTEGDGMSDYLADTCSDLDSIVDAFPHHSEVWTNYEDLLLCVELSNGKVYLISKYTYIEEIKYEFIIEEN